MLAATARVDLIAWSSARVPDATEVGALDSLQLDSTTVRQDNLARQHRSAKFVLRDFQREDLASGFGHEVGQFVSRVRKGERDGDGTAKDSGRRFRRRQKIDIGADDDGGMAGRGSWPDV